MSEICPFCHTEIPNGAVVCRGCGANKRPAAQRQLLMVSAVLAIVSLFIMMNFIFVVGVVIFVVSAILGVIIYNKSNQFIWVRSML
jgi:hypothetical protein